MVRISAALVLLASALTIMTGCHPGFLMAAAGFPDTTSKERNAPVAVNIGLILTDPEAYRDREVALRCAFARPGEASCEGYPPVSIDDWMAFDPSGCLYVHGPRPPRIITDNPRPVYFKLSGRIRFDADNRPYLDLVKN